MKEAEKKELEEIITRGVKAGVNGAINDFFIGVIFTGVVMGIGLVLFTWLGWIGK